MRKTGITKTCPICDTKFYVKRRDIRPVNCCSRPCSRLVLRHRRWKEIEADHDNKPIKEILEYYYYGLNLGINKTAQAIGVSSHVTWDWFDVLDIPRRSRSDAVALQWVDNNDRKQRTSKMMRDNHQSGIIDNFGDNNPAKAQYVRDKISASKQGENNPMWGKFGEANHMWQGGKVTYRGKGWYGIKEQVKRRDNNKCRRCGNNENLQVHHIIPYRDTADNSFDNLVTLCQPCHMKVEYHNAVWD